MATQAPPPWSAFIGVRWWPTWLGIGALCICAWLPFRLRMWAGAALGYLTFAFARERRYITDINLALCFPELNAQQRHRLLRQCFIDNGIGLIETASGWVRPPHHFADLLVLKGAEHLDAALATGRGVLMLGAHYSTLDFGANLLSVHYPFAVTYRAHRNALFDAFMLRGRLRNCNGVFDRRDIRGAFRHLKQNKILWYAPDQDYGPEQAVYAPLFGHAAATITAASRFAGFNQSPVIFVRQYRDTASKRYTLEFTALTPPLPTGDELRDATIINATLEHALRQAPSQYLWMHKRFKTQAGGKPDSPYVHIKTPDKILSEAQYSGMQVGTVTHAATGLPMLASGLVLREFAGIPGPFGRQRHPAYRLDQLSKLLRAAGLRTQTIDNLFRVPERQLTAATCFIVDGAAAHSGNVSNELAAGFLARMHDHGFYFRSYGSGQLAVDARGLAVLDPLQVAHVRGSVPYRQRLRDLQGWAQSAGSSDMAALLRHYLPQVRRADAAGFRAWIALHPALADNAPDSPAGSR